MTRLWRWLRFWVWTLVDAIPPYRIIEGPLRGKDLGRDGRLYIQVQSARIEVDRGTFETLEVGEELRVRHTKGGRAVSIDRLRSDEPGE